MTGFSAKEAVISTLSVLTGTSLSELGGALSSLFSPLSAVSFLVFTLLYTPCVAAVAAIRRELRSGSCHAGRRAYAVPGGVGGGRNHLSGRQSDFIKSA